ncbi:hypothetical protein FOMG_19871 [Fusarium oxysporum f. sp. melonis 26406]|uniref:Uncharacterized protein n=1 Tax=Fusarium oxysporum f. sp. melonis 26406 TaxID=1089452 RepID=W9Z512_FUSOX|nr:hypothetical protein FOMG_19871 [Fusarium oxysporum f. sp. melonis 26406]
MFSKASEVIESEAINCLWDLALDTRRLTQVATSRLSHDTYPRTGHHIRTAASSWGSTLTSIQPSP